MGLLLNLIYKKKEISKRNEKYLLNLLNSGKITPFVLIENLKNPTVDILQTAYDLGDKLEKEFIVSKTPINIMKKITNHEYILDLVSHNYENYKCINLDYLRNKHSKIFNATVILKYRDGLEEALRLSKKALSFSSSFQDMYNMYLAERDLMSEEFEYAESIMDEVKQINQKIIYYKSHVDENKANEDNKNKE